MPGISSMSGGLHPGDVSTSGVFVSSLCDGGRWRVWDDLHWVTSMPLKFPAFQACACGPLVPDRQPSPRQEVSKHKDPHSRPAQGSGCQLWPSGVMGQGRDECEALCKDRKKESFTSKVSQTSKSGPWVQRLGAGSESQWSCWRCCGLRTGVREPQFPHLQKGSSPAPPMVV